MGILNNYTLKNTMEALLEKYGLDWAWIELYLIKIDGLTEEQLKDLDYVEDRIETHLENQD